VVLGGMAQGDRVQGDGYHADLPDNVRLKVLSSDNAGYVLDYRLIPACVPYK
jgi:hypothetical protein